MVIATPQEMDVDGHSIIDDANSIFKFIDEQFDPKQLDRPVLNRIRTR